MKQLLQNIKTGWTELIDVPIPACKSGHLLLASRVSLVSVGTERMLVDFGKAGWIEKARQQPEKVKQVLDKIRTDGLLPTAEAVFNKLDEPMPLGYCNAGVVLEVGHGITDFQPGDRVASNGSHAEIVCVPRNLCAKIPQTVSDEEATFTVLGSIALQGIRLMAPSLGERFMVFGLGLVGLLTVQLLRANGCRVLAVDISDKRLRLAELFGAETVNLRDGADPITSAMAWSDGKGVDGVIIAASAKGDDIVHQAVSVCRKRGRIVLVGVVDLNLRRSDFYEKEIAFQVS
jgi:threonine dehydrogenase-like Zn-dependent dehydrogenase